MADVDIRHGDERRHHDRRSVARGTGDRRMGDRRRATMRNLLFTGFAFLFPHELKSALPILSKPPLSSQARVSTTIRSFDAVEPKHAYDALIAEAAATWDVDP